MKLFNLGLNDFDDLAINEEEGERTLAGDFNNWFESDCVYWEDEDEEEEEEDEGGGIIEEEVEDPVCGEILEKFKCGDICEFIDSERRGKVCVKIVASVDLDDLFGKICLWLLQELLILAIVDICGEAGEEGEAGEIGESVIGAGKISEFKSSYWWWWFGINEEVEDFGDFAEWFEPLLCDLDI